MFSTGFARYFATLAVAPDVAPVTTSPVMNPLFAVMNSFELKAISSVTIYEIAPDVPPVIVSPFTNALPKVFSSCTTFDPLSKPAVFVWLNKR